MPAVTATRYLVTAGWDDVPHLDAKTKKELWDSSPPHEREARAKGIPTLGSGRIFPVEEEAIKVAPFPIPAHWARINGIDFGWDHPTAGVQLAWDRDNDCIYVTQAHRRSQTLPVVHATTMKAWGTWVPTSWPHDGEQHDKGSGEQLAKQYAAAGLLMLRDRATFEDGSNGVEAGLMEMLERMQTGRLKVFSHLGDWFQEFKLYHRKDGKVVKKLDDLMSATRYAIMMKRKAITRPAPPRQAGGGWNPLDREIGY
ncbi:terminase family protein [Acidovorax sp. LjRoot74]|uniref:phage terminase large subunit family protein n=1 Tax=Acidovorax sp. LjRoot74 TaxID=3342337 RepID=UPI003ECE476B